MNEKNCFVTEDYGGWCQAIKACASFKVRNSSERMVIVDIPRSFTYDPKEDQIVIEGLCIKNDDKGIYC